MVMASYPTRQRVRMIAGGFRRCDSQKVGYPTKDEALTVAERMMDAGKVTAGCHITPYLCNRCAEWHVFNRCVVFQL